MVSERQDLVMQFYPSNMRNEALDKDVYGSPCLPENPKVSVCVITYKHEDYITTCLDSILNQQTNFDFEVILGEDHSPDATPGIVRKYADAFPNRVKAFIRPKNVGAKSNFLHCFLQTKGEYVIYIEGDDYWTDTQKLQKQVDFLDKNPAASACFHNAEIIYEDGSGKPSELINTPQQAIWTTTSDFFKERETWFMATASVMMRRKWVSSLPEWFKDCKSGDIPMYVILAEQGPIGYLPDIMSVYRKNLGGQSFTDSNKSKDFLLNRIFMYTKLNEYTEFKFDQMIRPILAEYHELLIHCSAFKWNYFKQFYHLNQAHKLQAQPNGKTLSMLLKEHIIPTNVVMFYLRTYSFLNRIFKNID